MAKAADAASKAVMADTDEASVASSREAEQAKQAVQTNVDALQPISVDTTCPIFSESPSAV